MLRQRIPTKRQQKFHHHLHPQSSSQPLALTLVLDEEVMDGGECFGTDHLDFHSVAHGSVDVHLADPPGRAVADDDVPRVGALLDDHRFRAGVGVALER